MIKNKRKTIILIMVIIFIILLVSIFVCIDVDAGIGYIDTEYFKCHIYEYNNQTCISIDSLTKKGLELKEIVIPDFIDTYPVANIEFKFPIENIKKIYIPCNLESVNFYRSFNKDNWSKIDTNKTKIFYINCCFKEYASKILKGYIGYPANEEYNQHIDYYQYANIQYYYNYENSPNDGLYFIDDLEINDKLENIPVNPTRSWYDFTGWYLDSECINKVELSEYKKEDSEILCLYAGWKEKYSAGHYEYNYKNENGNLTLESIKNIDDEESGCLEIPMQIGCNLVTRIADNAFADLKFNEIILPDSIWEIGDCAFRDCVNIKSVNLPQRLHAIGNNAFMGCQLAGVVKIGSQLTNIGELAFGTGDIQFNVDFENQHYSSENGSLYNKNKTCLIKYGGTSSIFIVPSTVTTIGKYAFYGNQDLISISIPNVGYVDEYAFYNSMVTIITDDSMLNYVGEMAFEGTPWLNNNNINGFVALNGLLIRYIDVPGVTEVTIPENIIKIMRKAFKGSNIECVSIPSNVEFIYGRIFEDCLNIAKIKFTGHIIPSVEGLLTDGIGNNQLKIYVPYYCHEDYENALSYLNENNGPFNYIYKIHYYDITSITYYEEDDFISDDLPLSLRSSAANTGGTFVGWSDNPVTFNQVQNISSIGSDIKLYAFYQYTITFELDNGEPDIVYNVIYNDSVNVPTPTKEGQYLSNWHNETNMGSYPANVTSIKLIENENWRIRAKWLPYYYVIVQ